MNTSTRSLLLAAAIAALIGCATHRQFRAEGSAQDRPADTGAPVQTKDTIRADYIAEANIAIREQHADPDCSAPSADEPERIRARALFGTLATAHCDAAARGDTYRPFELIGSVTPDYPVSVPPRLPVAGSTWVGAEIDETGAIARVEFLAATDPRIVASVEPAVRQWRFQPATVNGTPVRAMFIAPFTFQVASR